MQDPTFQKLFDAAQIGKNHLMIKDSSFIPPHLATSYYGHIDDLGELFASAFFAYKDNADQLTRFIQNEALPDEMKHFGKATWGYLRDKVFQGKVFSSDHRDPFVDFDYLAYASQVSLTNEHLLTAFSKPMQPFRGSALGYNIDTNEVNRNLPHYLSLIQDNSNNESVRRFLFQAMLKDGDGFMQAANKLLVHRMSENQRIELINILGQYYGFHEEKILSILLKEKKRGNPQSWEVASCIVRNHIDDAEKRKLYDPENVDLSPEFIRQSKMVLSQGR